MLETVKKNKPYFLLRHQEQTLQKFEVDPVYSQIIIGRKGYDADIEIASQGISRKHAVIEMISEGHFRIKDNNSTNGTYLNGVRIQESNLRTGDVVSFQKNKPEFLLFVNSDYQMNFAEKDDKNPVPLRHLIEQQKTLAELLKEKETVIIGRQEGDIILSNLTISRRHTSVTRLENDLFLVKDLGSKNGTYVNGEQITSPAKITSNDFIQVGKYEFNLRQDHKTTTQEEALPEEVIVADNLHRVVGKGNKKFNILNDIHIKVNAGEFIAIMGPSGSGKSTLLKALNGDAPATSGKVYIHGRDFYKNYKRLKQDIGYVPQDDIVHPQLSVYKSLFYAARLRLASDVSKEEIDTKIAEILEKLGILHIKDFLVKEISGGQRKRVSIAVELLSDPSILFLDEPTSPLDPETIEEFLKILKRLTESGTTIMMVTHKPDDLDSADKVIFLSKGGFLSYYGPVKEYLTYFKTQNVIGVYARINDLEKGRDWAKKFTELYPHKIKEFAPNDKIIQPANHSLFRQFYWLAVRYGNIKTNDRVNTGILLLQAPLIALLLGVLFEKIMLQTLFLMLIASIWLGTSNSAREIVSELPIYRRERMFNLRILPYIFSKLLIISFFSLIQVILMAGIVYLMVGLPHYGKIVGILFLVAFTGNLLGLFLSSVMDNADKVMSIVPLVLLPQIMLAGVIHRIHTDTEWLSFLTISRWGIEATANIEKTAYFYYPEEVPNVEYTKAMEGVNPLDIEHQKSIQDSLRYEAGIPETLEGYVEEKILDNTNMLRFPTYFSFSQTIIIIGIHCFLLFTAILVSLKWKDRL